MTEVQAVGREIQDALRRSNRLEQDLIRLAPQLHATTRLHRISARQPVTPHPNCYLAPALAIPLAGEAGFVCPDRHLDALRESFPQVTEILVLGWAGGAKRFLKELASGLRGAVRVLVVCGSEARAREAASRIQTAGVQGQFEIEHGGFTDFVVSRRLEAFLDGAATRA